MKPLPRRPDLFLTITITSLLALIWPLTRPPLDAFGSDPLINEFVADHVGLIDTHDFIEVFGQPTTDYETFTLLVIEGDNLLFQSGVIDDVFPVGSSNNGGFWTTGFINNQLESGSFTILLVENFTGSQGDDLDTNNDGSFDSTPWSRIVDDVAVFDGGFLDNTYSTVILTGGFDGVADVPGGASRIPNGIETNTTADWRRNDFNGAGLPGFTGTPEENEALNTPNTINLLAIEPAAELVINEIDYTQPGSDTAEFIEIRNNDTTAVNLTNYSLALIDAGTVNSYQTIPFPDATLDPDSYFVICGNIATVPNCDLDVSPDVGLIENGAPDAVALFFGNDLIDTLSYEGDTPAPYTEGSGAGLIDSGASGEDDKSLSRFPDGLDSDQNNNDFRSRCITPGLPNSSESTNCIKVPEAPRLVINEFDYDQPGNDPAEFVELKNSSTITANLSGFVLDLVDGDSTAVYQTIPLPDNNLLPGDYFVICDNPANVPNCDLDISPLNFGIQNGAPDALALTFNDQIVDTVSYEGDTAAPYTEGTGIGFEDQGVEVDVGLSRFPDGLDTDRNNSDFSLRCITPGQTNSAETCLTPPSGGPEAIFLPIILLTHMNGEPNNTCDEAISLVPNRHYQFLADDTDDWYLFDLVTTASVTIELTDFEQTGQITAWEGDCVSLDILGNNGNDQPTKIIDLGVMGIGRYYVWVINDDAPTNSLPYHLEIKTD